MSISDVKKALVRPVTTAAAIVGLLQALAWTLLALVSILFYHKLIPLSENLSESSYEYIIYQLLLNSNSPNTSSDGFLITPFVFQIFMYVYIGLSFLWLLVSVYLLWDVDQAEKLPDKKEDVYKSTNSLYEAMNRDKWESGPTLIGGWAALTIVISLLDVSLVGLVANDFIIARNVLNPEEATTTTTLTSTTLSTSTILTSTTDPTSTETSVTPSVSNLETFDLTTLFSVLQEEQTSGVSNGDELVSENSSSLFFGYPEIEGRNFNLRNVFIKDNENVIYTVYVIILSLAARGYVLWIVNVVFGVILAIFSYNISNKQKPSLLPLVTAKERPYSLYDDTDIGVINDGFNTDEFNNWYGLSRSQSFQALDESELQQRNSPNQHDRRPISYESRSLDRFASVGQRRQALERKSPPLNIPPPMVPIIPEPDYTPPSTPKGPARSVLRSNSNYIY